MAPNLSCSPRLDDLIKRLEEYLPAETTESAFLVNRKTGACFALSREDYFFGNKGPPRFIMQTLAKVAGSADQYSAVGQERYSFQRGTCLRVELYGDDDFYNAGGNA